MKKILFALMVCCGVGAMAQSSDYQESYYYSRGLEALQERNMEEAWKYFSKEVEEHPDNGYAYMWVAYISITEEEDGDALKYINKALKHIPNKDKDNRAFATSMRAAVKLHLEDTAAALKDYASAIALDPEEGSYYAYRAETYYQQGKFDLSNKDYDKMIELEAGEATGYLGKGRNCNAQKRYKEAIPFFNHAIKLHSDNSYAYVHRAESYMEQKQYDKALDDVVSALDIDGNNKAFYLMIVLADSAYEECVTKFKVQKVKEPNRSYWDYCLGVIHEEHEDYTKAIECYKSTLDKDADDIPASRIADCYDELGDYARAVEYINIAIQLDSSDYRYLLYKATYQDKGGQSQKAIKTFDELLEKQPDYGFAYYRRGWIKDNSNDDNGALEDYSMAIALIPEYAYSYFNRGKIYYERGETEKAKKDFLKAIELDDEEDIEIAHYGYLYLGDTAKYIEILNTALEKDAKGNYYDAACLYSLMGETEKAVYYLRNALEGGYHNFAHIARDSDLDNIRSLESFRALIDEYNSKQQLTTAENKGEEVSYQERIVAVPFTKEGGVFRVKCTINGLPLHFIFDTGASDVTISNVEAAFMLKNDYLKASDFGGNRYYMTANGDITEGTIVTLRNIGFGGLTLENVKASVVKSQSAPLLLGQSALERLGKIEIDNSKRVLRITYQEKVQ